MKIRKFMSGASGLAFVLTGVTMAHPALAQASQSSAPSATPPSTDDTSKDDEAKKKTEEATPTTQAIVVTARRKALEAAIEIKRLSDTIVDSVVADDAEKLPDTSITEVLQRVSGVTLSRFVAANGGSTGFQIEGTGFTVRGLPYNSSTLNGQQVFSANGASAIQWGDVTPELMGGVDVYKASRADLIEGGTSSIDLRSHLPFDFTKTTFSATVGGSYGDQIKKASPNVSALFSKRWNTGIGEIGVVWDVSYSRYLSQSSDMQIGPYLAEYAPGAKNNIGLIPDGFNWSTSQNARNRYGAYQAVQWKPNSTLLFTNTVFYSRYVQNGYGTSAGFGAEPSAANELIPTNAKYDSNGGMQSGTLTYGQTGQVVFGAGGNTWLSQYAPPSYGGWSPAGSTDCGSQNGYGAPAEAATANWGAFTFGCAPLNLNLGSGSSAGHSVSSTLNIAQTMVWNPNDRLRVRAGGQFITSKADSVNMYVGIGQGSNGTDSATIDTTTAIPTVSGISQAALLNPQTAYINSMAYNGNHNKGSMYAFNIDVDYKLSDDGFFRSFSAGVRHSKRVENDLFYGTYYAPFQQTWTGGPGGPIYLQSSAANPNSPANPNDFSVYNFPGYFGGQVKSPGSVLTINPALLTSYNWYYLLSTYNRSYNTIPASSVTPATPYGVQTAVGTPAQYASQIAGGVPQDSRIKNFAAYAESKFAHDQIGIIPAFSGNIGVRVFYQGMWADGQQLVQNNQTFNLTYADAITNQNIAGCAGVATCLANLPTSTPAPVYQVLASTTNLTREYSFTRVLPSFNAKFDVSKQFIVRLAASESAAPPNLGDIRPGGNTSAILTPGYPQGINVFNGVMINGGGPELPPVMMSSEDISFEFYPKSNTYFYFDAFGKQIKDGYVFNAYSSGSSTYNALEFPNGSSASGSPSIATTVNGQNLYLQTEAASQIAHIKGFEIGGQTFFDHLPGIFKGLGISGNLTFIQSNNPSQEASDVLATLGHFVTTNGVTVAQALNPATGSAWQTYPNLPYPGLSKLTYNVQLLYNRGKLNVRLAYNWHDKNLLTTVANPLSFTTSGGNPYQANLSPTNFSATNSFPVYQMIPAWSAAAGYLDLGINYKVNDHFGIDLYFNNLTNTISKTLQEPMPGVFERYDTNVSDRRIGLSAHVRF